MRKIGQKNIPNLRIGEFRDKYLYVYGATI